MKLVKKICAIFAVLMLCVSIVVISAYATAFANYTTYDANYDFSGSRSWTVIPGTIKINAAFEKGGILSADSMETTVTASDWDSDYVIYAKSHIQTVNHNYYTDVGEETTSTSTASVAAGLFEDAQFAMHYGHFKNDSTSNSRYFKGMYNYQDGVGRTIMPYSPDEGEPNCY